jgi:hypothetical protein
MTSWAWSLAICVPHFPAAMVSADKSKAYVTTQGHWKAISFRKPHPWLSIPLFALITFIYIAKEEESADGLHLLAAPDNQIPVRSAANLAARPIDRGKESRIQISGQAFLL